VTEVPEHLLERTRQRRMALGLPVSGGADAPASGGAPAATATAVADDAAPAVIDPAVATAIAETPTSDAEVTPVSPAVRAAESRRKAPWWAITALVALPVWGFFYANSLERPVSEPALIAGGRELYAEKGCSGCHGADGEGAGAGPALTEVHETFPEPERMAVWIRLGTAGWADTFGADTPYGAQGRLIGDTLGPGAQMPSHGLDKLSAEELLEVVLFIRHGINEDIPITTGEPAEPTEADSLEDYELVLLDEDGLPVVDEAAEFTAVAEGGEAVWEEIIVADGGDLVIE
jgi:mono/diheme cytochrome c family protein